MPSAFSLLLRCGAALAAGLLLVMPARAQLRGLPVPNLPQLPTAVQAPVQRVLPALAPTNLLDLRRNLVDELLQREPRRLERDPQGHPIVRGEVVLSSPSVALLEAAQAAGFQVAREERLAALDTFVVVLRAPAGVGTAAALAMLRALDPQAAEDFNHLYLPAGSVAGGSAPTSPSAISSSGPAAGPRVGLVDGGVDTRHVALRDARIVSAGCERAAPADAHGTAVASLLVGHARGFGGAVPGATLYAADIYCGSPANGSLQSVLRALAWLAQEQVPVINLSLVGPPNRLLEQAVRTLQARGHVLVAAVGNDGPAAPPLYPAAYAGVLGVTGVDAHQRVLPEAAQGPQVALAAPGSEMAVAGADRPFGTARGTSFAAPLVAGLLARRLRTLDPAAAERAVAALSAEALDLGAPGRDSVYGQGLVAQDLRIDPARLR
ncbi:S8 family serine peptidase [Ideonella sp. BN130291]|uniref:S8 family serine peptidase n=1 Tax=Ideonella sp. BN130291 TaxID=3112940 RepID=UPI002E26EA1A|nr:S8 family serine peptidase [Ideonella sp. BN130291]